jgi:hypothetical protein
MLLFEFLTGDIEPGLPTFKLPPFQIERQVDDDEIQVLNFSDICAEIGAMGIALFPLVSILEQVAIAKTYCKFRIRTSRCGFLYLLFTFPQSFVRIRRNGSHRNY